MLKIEILSLLRCTIEYLSDQRSVRWVSSGKDQFQSRFSPSVRFKDAKAFLRPVNLPAGNIPAEAARVAQFLRLGQVNFTSAQGFFGPAEGGSFLGFPERALHRRHDPGEPRLENIICGAELESFNRHLFTQGSGNKDQRHLRRVSLGDLQGRQAVEGGKGII